MPLRLSQSDIRIQKLVKLTGTCLFIYILGKRDFNATYSNRLCYQNRTKKLIVAIVLMITVTVLFGNNNKYTMDIPDDTELGKIPYYITIPLKKQPSDILYYIINGRLIGQIKGDYGTLLSDCGYANYTVHVIFKDNDYVYQETDLVLNTKNSVWLKRKLEDHSGDRVGLSQSSNVLNQLLGQINQTNFMDLLVDEEVLIPTNQYNAYVQVINTIETGSEGEGEGEGASENEQHNCSICSEIITVGPVGKIRRCGHHFHNDCIKTHLTSIGNTSCPSCGQDVRD